jgi:hypothetical protein
MLFSTKAFFKTFLPYETMTQPKLPFVRLSRKDDGRKDLDWSESPFHKVRCPKPGSGRILSLLDMDPLWTRLPRMNQLE